MTQLPPRQADVVVIGSGPGGASVARGLAQAGLRVLVLERGKDYRLSPIYGTYLGALTYTDRHALLYTREGLNIIRPLMAGGATSMYCGCAAVPPGWLKADYGLDLETYVSSTLAELHIAPLEPELRGAVSTRLAEAGSALGQSWQPLLKFMHPARSRRFNCGAHCMLGCRCHAKWNAAEWVDQAVTAGANFVTEARVDSLLVDGQSIAGVRGRVRGQAFSTSAPVVVVAGGGIGSPLLLRQAGLRQAGRGLSMDTTVIVYGESRFRGNGQEPPMTYGWENDEDGYMLSTLVDPWLNYPLTTALAGWRYPLTWPRWPNTLGIMIKLKDDLAGHVATERDISKPLTAADQQRLDRGLVAARNLLIKAGAKPDTIFTTPTRGTHPCATVRLGEMLDPNLQTEIDNLYVCDASVFPAALARPTVLTILALGQRLAAHLAGRRT